MEGLNRRKGAATADMRIVLARSHAQAAAIDEATKKLGRLVGAKEGATDDDGAAAGGGGGAEAEGGGGDGDGADGGGGAAGDSDGDSDSGAALGGVAAEAGGARSLQVLKKVNLLRYLLLERAKMLACLQSDGVPNEPIAISLDEPADAAAAAAADEAAAKAAARGANARGTTASGEQKEGSLIEAVRAVRQKHEAEMLTYCEAYYARKGEREITRPKHIPPTIEEHKAKLAAALDALLAKAEDERASAIRTLRFQLVAATRTLNLAGAAVFDDVAVGARHAAVKAVKAAAAAARRSPPTSSGSGASTSSPSSRRCATRRPPPNSRRSSRRRRIGRRRRRRRRRRMPTRRSPPRPTTLPSSAAASST